MRNLHLKSAVAMAAMTAASLTNAQITFYSLDRFEGRSFTTDNSIPNLERVGFNDRASSVVVSHDRWEVCSDARFGGQCAVLRPGRYATLADLGLNDRISSVRAIGPGSRVDDARYAPLPEPMADRRWREPERLFEAEVTAVRAVVGPPQQRCWIERDRVSQDPGPNVPGAVAGALLGGILGHQVGGGFGKDLATAGGAIAGAAVGANVGREDWGPREVRHCAAVPAGTRPAYWDVTYHFEGVDHRVQMASAPGRTITVNRLGEPRG